MGVYDNLPFSDIESFVRSDLSRFDQETPCPISMTKVFPDGSFRHYELGSIMGFILIGKITDRGISTMISTVEEDDEYWFAPNTPMYIAGAWIPGVTKTWDRMSKWYNEHISEGFEKGVWKTTVKKEIVDEEIYREDGQAASPVLEGPNFN